MAKFCMFCGESLPDAAIFCPSCGNKQQIEETKPQKEEVIEEEESDELDLLSQFGYIKPREPKKTKPPFTPTSKKEQKIDNEIDDKKDSEESSELEVLTKTFTPKKPQKETVVKTPVKEEGKKEEKAQIANTQKISLSTKKEEILSEEEIKEPKEDIKNIKIEKEEAPKFVKQEQQTTKKEPQTKEDIEQTTQRPRSRRQSVRHSQATNIEVPFKPTETKKNENAMPVMEEKEEQYDLPDDFSIDNNDSDEFCSLDEMLETSEKLEEEKKLKEELEKKKQAQKEQEMEAIAAKKPEKGTRGFFRRRKEIINVDEEEEFNTQLTSVDGGKTMMEQETLYADEIENNKKYSEASTDEDDDNSEDERIRTGEGRKQVQTNTKQRRKSSRSDDINKKIYHIEHDLSEMDPEELEYDGYYENVLPIDYDSLEKKKINPKIVLAVLGGVALIALAVYIITLSLGL